MPLGTLDRTPPPFFKQGPSAFTKLMVFSALAVFLMVADARFKLMQPLRAGVAAALFPVQWAALGPVKLVQGGGSYVESLAKAQAAADAAERKLAAQSARAGLVEQLTLENRRLRDLLALRAQLGTSSVAAEVMYDAADPYTRKVVIGKGMTEGVVAGSPVLDEAGVLGQVTRVYPTLSEVTLLIDRDQAIPVLNTRTGARSVAYGEPSASGGQLELRFMAGNSDIKEGDVLATSGVDGVYPSGLLVAKIDRIERRADSAFARVYCLPMANMVSARHVVVLQPMTAQLPEPPPRAEPVAPVRKGRK